MKKDSLGDRMKAYEAISQIDLMRKAPMVMRLDGKAFHTFTRGLERPYDEAFTDAMSQTMLDLCNQVQGAVFAYKQSDEISIVMQDWKTIDTDAWFGGNVQKIVSVAASIATASFNRAFKHPTKDTLALFDARVFSLPTITEVENYFIWRQNDCTRNSIASMGQAHFSQKELHGVKMNTVKQMLLEQKGVVWENEATKYRRGVCATYCDGKFSIDNEPPIFTQDRVYILKSFENVMRGSK